MCGIYGTVNPSRDFIKLFNLNRDRGLRHTSIFGPTMRLVFDEPETGLWIPTTESWLLGHNHAPTAEESADRHPIQYKNWFVAHNGVIHKPKVSYRAPQTVDSAIIPWELSNGMAHLGEIDGTFACWAYNYSEKQIYLFRWVNPLYANSELFTSVWSENGDLTKQYELEEGKVYKWPQLEVVAEFKPTYHPYK